MRNTPARTDPRALRTRQRVMRAVADLVTEDGAWVVTHQRVAERAGVGRATVYRHWPTSADLLYDAMAEVEAPLFRPGVGPLLPWLRTELSRISVALAAANGVQFTALIISKAQVDPDARALRDRLVARSEAPLAEAIERAVSSGELIGRPPVSDLLALLVGPLQFRLVSVGGAVDDTFLDAVIASALAPWLAPSTVSRGRS